MEALTSPSIAHDPALSGALAPVHVSPAKVQRVLEDVLASTPFCHTQQCQNLLRYIVRHSLAQEDHLLRERVIGAEVFGRRPDYDTGEDPVVRIRVAEVRKRLAQFYQSAASSAHPPEIFIEIPSGTYRASFREREQPPVVASEARVYEAGTVSPLAEPATAAAVVEETPPVTLATAPARIVLEDRGARGGLRTWWFVVAALLLLVAGVASVLLREAPQQRAFKVYWQPWLTGNRQVIIAVGSNAVYRLSDDFVDRYAREHNLQSDGMEFFVPTGPNTLVTGEVIHPAYHSFVALGDVAAISDIVATLTRQHQGYQERFPDDISFAEMRSAPAISIGGFNNFITMEMTKNMPFAMRVRNEIDDTRTPGRSWKLYGSGDSHGTQDYAILTRTVPQNGDSPMMSIAGLGQYGTLAATQFVCDPAAIARLVQSLPKGWAQRNLQVVLHVRVVDFKPESTDVVAVASW